MKLCKNNDCNYFFNQVKRDIVCHSNFYDEETMQLSLVDKIRRKEATIGIVGLGYVGLPLMLRYAQVGYNVIGFDIDQTKVDQLREGSSYIENILAEDIKASLSNGFEPTTDFSRIAEVDAIILCVPTPLNRYREPDLSYVIKTMETCVPFLRKGQVVSLESTTYPGTTDEELFPRINESGFEVGKDIYLVYSPEREDPGNKSFTTKTIPKICGGYTKACLEVGISLYDSIIDHVVPVSSTKTAEMTKLLENIHRAVNIGLVNEMKIVADRMGIDIHEVIDAAATKPFGFVAYRPGPGLGGHCIPIDPFYLTWKAREYGVHTRFIELAGEVNNSMPNYVVEKVASALNKKSIPLNGAKILVLGISYKKNVDDMRESPAVIIMELLRERGVKLSYSDPHISKFKKMREHSFNLESVVLSSEKIRSYDCVILTTDHDKFDYDLIIQNSNLLVDTRGKYKEQLSNLVKA